MDEKELLQEEEDSIITLTDDKGNETDFEYLDCVEYQGIHSFKNKIFLYILF